MEDNAYRFIYGNAVFHDIRVVLIALLRELAHGNGHHDAESGCELVDISSLKRKVLVTLRISSSNTADKSIREAVEIGVMSKIPRGNGLNKTKTYAYLTAEQSNKVSELLNLFQKIDQVIEAQAADPSDLRAGAEHVPIAVYYNIDLDYEA